ncbi:related to endothelin-converting enzyme 1 [Cephalotrichum gorgonifer]|uniref:Related to endothelin-converting enzyme 1 n=1 Tax=Cephalotrichum gorgonifer TaxID=2041049 RepID=A0AAE8N4K8_9PEZI|nr:related to endothelin-converting enzyme 1 [Cephalotrichum gorgonifer]
MAPVADSSGLCTTPACLHIASEILLGLDPNYSDIDPCTDFDQYVCGNWSSSNPIPPGQLYTDTLAAMADRTYDVVTREILDGPYPSGSDDANWITVDLTDDQATADKGNFDKVQTAYAACMNYTAYEEEGLQNLKRLVKFVVDDFPAAASDDRYEELEEPQDYSAAMGNTLTLLESLGIETTQTLMVKPDNLDPDEFHILVVPGAQSLPATAEEELTQYVAIAAELLSAVHPAELSVERSTALIQAVVTLQKKLAKSQAIAMAGEYEALEKAGKTGTELTTPNTSLAEIQKALPLFNYEYIVIELAPKGYVADKVALPGLSYYRNMSATISRAPGEVVQTFFILKALVALAPQRGYDPESPTPRERKCAQFVDSGVTWLKEEAATYIGPTGLTWILSRFFVEKTFPPKAKDLTADLEVKNAASKKVKDMAEVISLPLYPEVLDPIAIKKYYEDVEITPSHFANALSLAKVNTAQKWARLGTPFKRGQFPSSTLVPNAFHVPQSNLMILLAGIQQFPLFDVDLPSYILFGGMGSIVGHEITHGLDDSGRHFDSTGNLTTWWDESTTEKFTERTECFVSQYDKFNATAADGTEVAVSGKLTLGENIADAGGVASSFTAWQNWEDVHSPAPARIKLTLENSEGFKKAFKCPKKEPV